jgi:hypothetical protein
VVKISFFDFFCLAFSRQVCFPHFLWHPITCFLIVVREKTLNLFNVSSTYLPGLFMYNRSVDVVQSPSFKIPFSAWYLAHLTLSWNIVAFQTSAWNIRKKLSHYSIIHIIMVLSGIAVEPFREGSNEFEKLLKPLKVNYSCLKLNRDSVATYVDKSWNFTRRDLSGFTALKKN